MKWLDDIKDATVAFRQWGRVLTAIAIVIACSLVAIAIELFVICLKM